MRKQKKERKTKRIPIATWYASWKADGFPGLALYIGMIVGCAAVIGSVMGMLDVERRVLTGQVAPVPQVVHLTFENLPDWMPNELGEQLARDLKPDDGTSYNDPRLVADVCERAQAHPWIARVERVTKRLAATRRPDPSGRLARDGEIVIRAQYRQPAARVLSRAGQRGEQWVYVDRDGVRLPDEVPTYHAAVQANGRLVHRWFMPNTVMPPDAQPLHYVDIQGVRTPAPDIGEPWNADDLANGLKLAAELRRYAWQDQITTIDVRNHDGPLGLRMLANASRGQTRILFGRFPRENGDWEIPSKDKLDKLDKHIRDTNGLASGDIDLRAANLLVRFD